MQTITIVNYGLGNIGSVFNMLRKIGVQSEVTSDPTKVENARKLILPGVGSFDHGIESLERLNLIRPLENAVMKKKIPILGICLGAQLFTRASDEGKHSGLGWIPAETRRFCFKNADLQLPVPNIGWSVIQIINKSPLVLDLPSSPRFYFVHSYHFACENRNDVMCTAKYGYEFDAAFSKGNIFGVQFHPEKSHRFGMKIFSNFACLDC